MFIDAKTGAEESACVASLVSKCNQVRSEFPYSDEDTRTLVLNNVRVVAYSAQMVLNLLDSWTIGNEQVRSAIPQLLGLRGVTDQSATLAGNSLRMSSKLSLGLLSQFQIENCLRNLSRELGLPTRRIGFYNLAKSLLRRLELGGGELEILNVAALIRNSLHSNGIHYGYDGENTYEVINGVPYEFIHEQPVTCASVAHTAHAIEASIEVLHSVFGSCEISALADPVMDRYVWERATAPGS